MAQLNQVYAMQTTFVYGDTAAKLVGSLPANATIISAKALVTTAFNSGTSNLLDIGTSADPDHYVDGTDLSSTGAIACTLVVGNVGIQDTNASTPIYATHIPAGTAATTGACEVIIEFYQN